MTISVQKLPNCHAVLDVLIPAEVVQKERDDLLKAFSQQARIPGFRPGKAPKAVIEKRFSSNIKEELDGRLMDQAFREALKEDESLKVIDVKWPDALEHQPEGTARLSATLILAPDFELPEYKGVEIKIPKAEVTDELIDAEITNLRRRQAEFGTIEDRPLQEEDVATIDFNGSCDGQPISEIAGQDVGQLATSEGYWVRIDEESFLPGFATQLVGMNVGDKREITVTVQEDFPLESLRLKDLTYEVTLTGIKEETLPSDEELVEKLMPNGSMDDIREAIDAQLKFQMERQLAQAKENILLDQIANSVDFELPDEYLTSETQGQADRMVEEAVQQGLSEEELAQRQEEIFETAGQRARNNLKVQFLLSEIATAEQISVPDPEFLEHLNAMAKRANKPAKTYIKQLQRERKLDGIRNRLLIGKTIDFLLEHANVIEVEDNEDESATE